MLYIKYLIFISFLFFLLYEIKNIYRIIFKYNQYTTLQSGRAIKISKSSTYIRGTLDITIEDKEKIRIHGDFRNTVRWWLQKVPSIGETVYFYTSQIKSNKELPILAYGINPRNECSKFKLYYDLLYDYQFNKSIGIFMIVLIAILFGNSPSVIGNSYNINFLPLIYMISRFFLGSILL